MSTATEIMQKFMAVLDDTTSTGTTALDEAVQACSDFSGIQDLIDSFLADCTSAGDADTFLNDYCGIDLTNADTGAISGSDAGGTTVRTASSIVEEGGTASYPTTTSSVIDGLTVVWPTRFLTSSEQTVVADLNSWWISSALSLIQESYGLSFTESGTSTTTLRVQFYNSGDGTLAGVSGPYTDRSGTTYLTLNINMYYYSGIASGDEDGVTSVTGTSQSLDRVIAHELVHAVMSSTMSCFDSLPEFITEGVAELVQGVDDKWTSMITELAGSASELASALDLSDTGTGDSTSYAAGYMLLRYLAQQTGYGTATGTTTTSSSAAASVSGSVLTFGASSATTFLWLGSGDNTYSTSVKTIDASALTGEATLVGWGSTPTTILGGSGTNYMWGGGSASDTMQGGTGTNIFYWASGDGTDTITTYNTGTDLVRLYAGGFSSITTSGTNVVITADSSSLTIDGAADQRLSVEVGGQTYDCWFARTDQANSVTYSTDINFYDGASSVTDTLLLTGSTGRTINLQSAKDIWYTSIDVVDASSSSGTNILIGDAAGNTLIAGSGTTGMWGGGSASDTMQGGSGADTFWYGTGDGTDTITGGQAADAVYFYNADFDQISFSTDGTNLTIALGGSDTLTITSWTQSALNTFRFADQSEYSFTASGTSLAALKTK